ncbi:unnamed protein product, partial [Sphagnum balticum]
CQPWTIALTRVFGMTVSWFLLHSVPHIAVVSVLESAWWFLFLYSYPLSYTQMIAQRRKDQKDGVGRHIWNETEQQLVFDLIASAPGHL